MNFCQFGAGRIEAIHAGNIAAHAGARLRIALAQKMAAFL
jgi:hypothetical protein